MQEMKKDRNIKNRGNSLSLNHYNFKIIFIYATPSIPRVFTGMDIISNLISMISKLPMNT